MWKAIRPEEAILKLDFLRNAIFTRCTTVLAADPAALVDEFLSWLKSTLVDKTLSWQHGNTQFSLNLPKGVLASMCIRAALAAQEISSSRRDRLVEIALTKYSAEPGVVELGAQLYNTGREPLDLSLPWQVKSDMVESWQVGIVKNATNTIIQAILQECSPQEDPGR